LCRAFRSRNSERREIRELVAVMAEAPGAEALWTVVLRARDRTGGQAARKGRGGFAEAAPFEQERAQIPPAVGRTGIDGDRAPKMCLRLVPALLPAAQHAETHMHA